MNWKECLKAGARVPPWVARQLDALAGLLTLPPVASAEMKIKVWLGQAVQQDLLTSSERTEFLGALAGMYR